MYRGITLCGNKEKKFHNRVGQKEASMLFHFDKRLRIGLMMVGLVLGPAFLWGKEGYAPTRDGGNFGLGLELGDPGSWGITGKFWVDRKNAFQGAVKLPGGAALLQLDYLWHDFDLIHVQRTDGE